MTELPSRRLFVAAGLIALALPQPAVAALQAGENEDWGVFAKLAGIFTAIQAATDPIADGITRLRFVRFLNGINAPLSDILREKNAVLDALEIGTCGTDSRTVEALANRSARRIIPLVDILQQKVSTLSTAIKPQGTREAATRLAQEMGVLRSRKMWVQQINGFCSQPPERREAFVARVRQSIAIVQQSQQKLDALIETLSD